MKPKIIVTFHVSPDSLTDESIFKLNDAIELLGEVFSAEHFPVKGANVAPMATVQVLARQTQLTLIDRFTCAGPHCNERVAPNVVYCPACAPDWSTRPNPENPRKEDT